MAQSTVTDSKVKETSSSTSKQQSRSESQNKSQSQQQTSGTSQSKGQSQSRGQSSSVSKQQSQQQTSSTTQNVLDSELMREILAGLTGAMTDEQISAYAENLLRPQLNAGLEAARQGYETTKLAKEQEIANLAASLERSIGEQNAAYRQSAAGVETAALARGMGRSSYTLETLAQQGDALAKAVRQLTDENARQSGQIQQQITQAARQNAATQGRLNTDFASQLAAKVQELKENQRREYNSAYLTAVSSALGKQTTGSQTGSSLTEQTGTTHNTTTQQQDGATSQTSTGTSSSTQQTSSTGETATSQQSEQTSHSTTGDAPVASAGGGGAGGGSGGGGGRSGSSSSKKTATGTTVTMPTRAVNGRWGSKESVSPKASTPTPKPAPKRDTKYTAN